MRHGNAATVPAFLVPVLDAHGAEVDGVVIHEHDATRARARAYLAFCVADYAPGYTLGQAYPQDDDALTK